MIAGVIGASNEAIHTIEEAKKQGVKVIAFDGNPDAEGLRAADKAVVMDITNEEATIEAVRQQKSGEKTRREESPQVQSARQGYFP